MDIKNRTGMLNLNMSKKNKGLMLSRLLILSSLSGILLVLTASSTLSEVKETDEDEAIRIISTLNTLQKNYFLKNRKFAENISDLGIRLPQATSNYKYATIVYKQNFSPELGAVTNHAQPLQHSLKAVIGGVMVRPALRAYSPSDRQGGVEERYGNQSLLTLRCVAITSTIRKLEIHDPTTIGCPINFRDIDTSHDGRRF